MRESIEKGGTAFKDRIFTGRESNTVKTAKRKYGSYAARFAAKEAVRSFGHRLRAQFQP